MSLRQNIFIPGGGGYVGAVLVPKLLAKGYRVKVLDLFMFGKDVLNHVKDHPHLQQITGDVRDRQLLAREIPGTDAIIHLACISNDPSVELDPKLSKTINYDAFLDMVEVAKSNGVKRFIFASSSSVYGVRSEPEITEDLSPQPLTDYSRYKAECEKVLLQEATDTFIVGIIRPATVCGYSPRLRLDLTVNILTNSAINKGEITIYGGEQMRPNIHIEDITDLYCLLLEQPAAKIHKIIFNAGYENYRVREIAQIVNKVLGGHISIKTVATDDIRSYHVSSEKIKKELGFTPRHSVAEAVDDLRKAFIAGKVPDPLNDIRYYNIKTMKALKFE